MKCSLDDHSSVPWAIHGAEIDVRLGSNRNPVRILNQLNIRVPVGCIYGLIGPSGCGKTTFQRCVLGHYGIIKGSLRIFGKAPKEDGSGIPGPNVGYMPQDIALDGDLTIKEILTFFGRLYGLKSDEIHRQSTELLSIMNVNDCNKLASNLSLGQQRRVSLICSILHRPKLILLDEPTVGSDPLLVQNIWDYLLKLRKDAGVTILLATHYLEEVSNADYFGFMSHGRVIVEDTPDRFKRSQGKRSLEAAFLSFYLDKANCNLNPVELCPARTKPNLYVSDKPGRVDLDRYDRKILTSFEAFILLIWRYLSRWKRLGFYQILGMGLLHFVILTVIGLLFGHYPESLNIGIVDQDLSDDGLSSTYVDIFRNNTKYWSFTHFSDEHEARSAVEQGNINAYLLIGGDFSESIRKRVQHGLSPNIELNLITNGRLILFQDTTNRFTSDAIEFTAIKSVLNLTQAITRNNCDFSSWAGGDAIFNIEPIFGQSVQFEYLAPTNIVLVRIFFYMAESLVSSLIALWSVQEFSEPMNERLSGAGLKRHQLMVSQVFISTILFTPIFIVVMLVLIRTIAFEMNGSWTLAVVLTAGHVLCGITKGYMIGSMTKSAVCAVFIQCAYGFSGLFVGNIFWPYESLPYFMKPLRVLFPHTFSGDSAVRSFIYGQSITDLQVYSGILYALAHVVFSLVFVLVWFRSWS